MLVIAFSLMMLGMFVPFFYLPVYAVQHGMSPHLAFYLPSILNGASFFGRIIPGITADNLGAITMLGGSGLITGILLLCWPKCTSNASIIAFAALYGFFSGALVSLSSVCISRVSEDPRNMGTYLGMGMFVGAFSILIGPPISGALLARYGGYEQVGIFSGVVVLVSAFSILLVKRATGQGMFAKV
jgi:MFS family permease